MLDSKFTMSLNKKKWATFEENISPFTAFVSPLLVKISVVVIFVAMVMLIFGNKLLNFCQVFFKSTKRSCTRRKLMNRGVHSL